MMPAGKALSESPLPQGERRPVLVELFTSEGCSSCPPADALLIQLEKEPPVAAAEIIALGFHVDYWDDIGWKDRFSSSAFSRRQYDYAEAFSTNSVYTPQMVVDGHTQFVGSDSKRAATAIERATRAPKIAVRVSAVPAGSRRIKLTFQVPAFYPLNASDTAELSLAIAESDLFSEAKSGENTGRRLNHTAVVRHFRALGATKPGQETTRELELMLPSDWHLQNCRAVAFLQERRSRVVLGAAQISLAQFAQ
ncbi:MAG TPA: DUF1223 domain-containing protein, partial [Sphingomonadales bacterium]|nr:DUF1223 domain-containing protein [Sphingomonadales bacterium]